jgi:phosphohistidine phosphatase
MLTLTLMRHAKSDWGVTPSGQTLGDKDRPLARRGINDTPRMAAWIKTNRLIPELVLCSTAVRTQQTLKLLKQALNDEIQNIQLCEDLYLAEADDLIEIVRAVTGNVRHMMVLGHNPGLQDAAIELIGSGDAELRRALALKFPTAGVAVIDFPADRWIDVRSRTGKLRHFMAPKRLAAG